MQIISTVRLFTWMAVIVVTVMQSGCGPVSSDRSPGEQYRLQPVHCWFPVPATKPATHCFFMHVPQDYQKPDQHWIKFPVVRITGIAPTGRKSPVIHLGGGGPGNPIGFSPETDVTWLWNLYQGMTVLNHRDIYIIDPRGVGQAEPVLACPEYADMIKTALAENLTLKEESTRSMEAYGLCRERLEGQGVDLSQYHSTNIARDVEQLRRVLNIPKWNLYGVSYGTRYAQTIARDFPDTVEAMVLDATTFLNINYTERSAEDLLQTIERLFAYCENNRACSDSLGEFRQRFWKLTDSLNSNPPALAVNHPYNGEIIRVLLTGERFLNAYYLALYDAEFYAGFPEVVMSLENGKAGIFQNAVEYWLEYVLDRDYSDGAAIAHYCYEEAPFVDFNVARENTKNLPEVVRKMMMEGLTYSELQCQDWGVDGTGKIESQPLISDIPTLFLHGALDPVLPVQDLHNQAGNFRNSDRVIFDEISHGVIGVHPCGIELAREFYDNKLDYRKSVTCLN